LTAHAGGTSARRPGRPSLRRLGSLVKVAARLLNPLQILRCPNPHATERATERQTGLTRIITPGSAAYASMKGAIEVLTRYLAKELGPRRIAVNTVAPGAIATDFSGGVVRDNPEVNKRIADITALGRAGEPDDIGPMIASLLSQDNRWINAQRIEVSGGMAI
jgi:NAD(P)-dependent dehydrogenase (short-subunit alcohol dehydrogenase family)